MATYVCIRDFTTSLGKRYYVGGEISDTHYAILSYADKVNFRRKEEEPSSYRREAESFIPSPFDHTLGSSHQDNTPESPSFEGYGGGDGGGGGASSSWDSGGDFGGGDGGGGE